MHQRSVDANQLTDVYRAVEPYTSDIDGDTIRFSPTGRTGICCLVDPFHDGTAVNLAAEIHVGWFAEKLQRQATRSFFRIHAPCCPLRPERQSVDPVQLGADILSTTVAPTMDALIKLAILAAIRTFLNFFLQKELEQVEKRR